MPRKSKYNPGDKFNKWTLIERNLSKKRPVTWLARCDCGNEVSQALSNITSSKSTQCSICSSKKNSLKCNNAIIGKKFSYLLVLSVEKHNGKMQARVQCDCGNIKFLPPYRVKTGQYKSCGKCSLCTKSILFFKEKSCISLGAKRGMLTIVKEIDKEKSLAICECGKELEVKSHHMKTQNPSCGCYWKNIKIQNATKYIGLKWGYLKCVKFLGMQGPPKETRATYLLKCKCGNILTRNVGHMFDIRSCGCLQKESVSKGSEQPLSKTNEIEVATIRELFKSGLYSRKDLSSMMNLKYEHVCQILKNNTWKHVK